VPAGRSLTTPALYHVTTANAYSITGWAFKVTSAIIINHRWPSPDCKRILCSDTSGSWRRRLCHVAGVRTTAFVAVYAQISFLASVMFSFFVVPKDVLKTASVDIR